MPSPGDDRVGVRAPRLQISAGNGVIVVSRRPGSAQLVTHSVTCWAAPGSDLRLFKPEAEEYERDMKRVKLPVVLILLGVLLAAPLAWAAAAATGPAPAAPADRSPAAPLAKAVSTVTGLAISPLLGTAAYGAYQYVTADAAAREQLPWYAQMKFWLPALLIVGACAAKDVLGAAVPPGLKKPLDVLETFENKITGLVVAGAVVPITMGTVADAILAWQGGADPALHGTGLAAIQLGAAAGGSFLSLLTIPFGVAVFAVVWMAAHAINVLILLSPWGAIDAVLKSARTGLLGLVALTATINPWVGAALSLVVIVVAYFVAGWSFRLTVFGSVFCWDFLTGRSGRSRPKENDNRMFAGGNLPGVPARTYGRLVERSSGALEFFYRPWLVLAERRVTVPARPMLVGRGLFLSGIATEAGDTLFLLPPRYRGHEEELVRIYKFTGGVQPAGLRKAWSLLRELFGGAAAKAQVVA
jgi:hypothetical protein